MTAISEENGPEMELCYVGAPHEAVIDFLERHGEDPNVFRFGFDSDKNQWLYIRDELYADMLDVLVWRRGGRVLVSSIDHVPYIEVNAVFQGLIARTRHQGRLVSYWATDRRVVVDAVPIESKTATVQWMIRHPGNAMNLTTRVDGKGYNRPVIQTVRGLEFPRWYWLVWTLESGIHKPMTGAEWRGLKQSYSERGIKFRTVLENAVFGYERRIGGVN